jgi:hypothetical protein
MGGVWFNGGTDPSVDVGDLRGFSRMDLVHAEGARMATRVHLADDHTMFRQGLQSISPPKKG